MPYFDMEQVELQQIQVAVRQMLGDLEMGGLQHEQLVTYRNEAMYAMVMELRATVLAERGGDVVSNSATKSVKVDLPVRPRWMPGWLWRKVPVHHAIFTLTATAEATPMWTYPSANIKVPDLGPVRFAVQQAPTSSWNWRRP